MKTKVRGYGGESRSSRNIRNLTQKSYWFKKKKFGANRAHGKKPNTTSRSRTSKLTRKLFYLWSKLYVGSWLLNLKS